MPTRGPFPGTWPALAASRTRQPPGRFSALRTNWACPSIASCVCKSNKKTDVAEHPQVLDHVGLLVNRLPGRVALYLVIRQRLSKPEVDSDSLDTSIVRRNASKTQAERSDSPSTFGWGSIASSDGPARYKR